MKRNRLSLTSVALIVTIALVIPILGSAADPTLTTPDGLPVVWSDWVGENAPIAVLLWASWVPDADKTLADLDLISAAARARGLDLAVVVVQEPLEEATQSLGSIEVAWFHDRYGHLLKEFRVVSIPLLLVLSGDGKMTERIEVSPKSIRAWGGE